MDAIQGEFSKQLQASHKAIVSVVDKLLMVFDKKHLRKLTIEGALLPLSSRTKAASAMRSTAKPLLPISFMELTGNGTSSIKAPSFLQVSSKSKAGTTEGIGFTEPGVLIKMVPEEPPDVSLKSKIDDLENVRTSLEKYRYAFPVI
eukprot:GHVR01043282.1.p1 GENE.GHVR01043282.1~~GHVR01043282.1.p1  ORF type:complete len:146 (-),score=16.25 GHVR01043282.1:1160-1597(-)